MNIWIFLQVVLNLIFLSGIGIALVQLRKPPKDDPRLSKGLQLLQNKIAILEDLSDRTDAQVKQLSTLLDQKGRQVQEKIQSAEEHVRKIQETLEKSLEVSKIFESSVPHKEILERQNTNKYVQAARMAHKGMTAEQIAKKVDIPMSELEFIVKVNREKLMFAEDQLPPWIDGQPVEKDLSEIFEVPVTEQDSDIKLKEEFKKVVEENKVDPLLQTAKFEIKPEGAITEASKAHSIKQKPKTIRPYEFKKIGGRDRGPGKGQVT